MSSATAPKHLRIFLSSPGDVTEERRAAMEVIDRLPAQPLLRGRVTFEIIAWDDPRAPVPMHAEETPQRSVSRYAALPSQCDLTIVILWSRVGTPLPETEQRRNGTRYESGTVWEYEDARTAGRPIWVYRRTEKPQADLDDPSYEQKALQYRGVKQFLQTFRDADGSLAGGVNEDASPSDFARLLGSHLETWVRELMDVAVASADGRPSLHPSYGEEIASYRREFLRRRRRLDLDALMPADQGEIVRIPLPAIFVEPLVREDAPPLEISRDDVNRLLQLGELVDDDLASNQSLEEVRRVADVYYEKKAVPVFDIVGGPANERVVLLGDPGGGKSTLATYVALALLDEQGATRVTRAYGAALPILIELRNYVASRLPAGSCTDVFEFLDRLHNTDGYHPSAAAVRSVLDREEPVLFIFDGLDEIFVPEARAIITEEIARIGLDFASAKIMVTSRPIGYRRKILTDAGFLHYTIQELTPSQVSGFLDLWFATVMPDAVSDAEYRKARIVNELAVSNSVRGLAANPLLLTILAVIGKSRDLPRDRWMLYEHASAVLINHWDLNRQLRDTSTAPYIEQEDKIELLRRLAAKMQDAKGGLSGNYILKNDLERDFERYIRERYEVTTADAAIVARTIVKRLHERNFILAPRGAGLFGFVHRAFLEFFCAAWFKNRFEAKHELTFEQLATDVFDAHAGEPAWHEVLRLLAGAIDPTFTTKVILQLYLADTLPGFGGRANEQPAPLQVAPPWRLAVALLCCAELRRPALLGAHGHEILARTCEVFDADTIAPPVLFNFIKRHLVPHVMSVGTQWPERTQLAAILARRAPREYMYVYDHLFGTTIGAIGSGDKIVHSTILEYAASADPSRRVLVPFALAQGWPGEPTTFEHLMRFAREDEHPTVRYSAVYALGEHFRDREAVSDLISDKLVAGPHVFDRAPAATALARGARNSEDALRLLEHRLHLEDEKYPRTVIVQALVECFSEHPETAAILRRTAVNDPSPTSSDRETSGSWFPRQAALRGLVQLWPRAPETRSVLEERARNDQTEWLREWCRTTLARLTPHSRVR